MLTLDIHEKPWRKIGFFDERKMMILPINAESQMLSHLNMEIWNLETIKDIVAKITEYR